MKILVDENLCIGAAPCVAIAPDVFQLNEEGKAIVINPKGADDDTIDAATRACPVEAIFLYKEPEQIFPTSNNRKVKIVFDNE